MNITLVDTDILIDTALQISEAVRCLEVLENSSELAISVVTQIAATAIELDVDFVSKNQKDYRFIENLRLLAYPLS
ncbi:MAG: hypothetical protein AB1509_04745 [Chloroflexota bacterium]